MQQGKALGKVAKRFLWYLKYYDKRPVYFELAYTHVYDMKEIVFFQSSLKMIRKS